MKDPKNKRQKLESWIFAKNTLNFGPILNFKKLAFVELSDKTNHMSKINVGFIGTAQW